MVLVKKCFFSWYIGEVIVIVFSCNFLNIREKREKNENIYAITVPVIFDVEFFSCNLVKNNRKDRKFSPNINVITF